MGDYLRETRKNKGRGPGLGGIAETEGGYLLDFKGYGKSPKSYDSK
jgi:hypothetical protein